MGDLSMKNNRKATEINLTEKQEQHLRKLAQGTHSQLHYKQRAEYLLLANEGYNNSDIARECDCHRKTVRKWRNRWEQAEAELKIIEKEQPHKLKSFIQTVLDDEYRPGAPQRFKPEQIAEIIKLACQSPESLGLPFTHWSNSLLAKEAINRGIVDTISARHVGRILDEVDLKPHRTQSWLNPKFEDPEQFKAEVKEVCDIYAKATELESNGTHVICTDEMTGIQAIERCHPNLPGKPGYIERYEQEYTRKEEDFVNHIKDVVETDPEGNFIFIMDQLNTHKSESLVNYIIEECELEIDEQTLGKKGNSGILKSMETRKNFLSDPAHNIRIVYTPKHSSWLNQMELWFSILKRHLLNKRASFKSVEELEERIKEYIEYYNKNLAKPFLWTYTGKILKK